SPSHLARGAAPAAVPRLAQERRRRRRQPLPFPGEWGRGGPLSPAKELPMRTIALVNHSTLLGGADVARCGAALQTQVSRDFASTWGFDARLRVTDEPAEDEELLALLDDAGGAAALVPPGRGGRPCGFVLVRPCLEAGDAWQAVASHQLLELLADPLVNLAAEGVFQGKPALFALEVCDPVENDS